MYCLQPLGGLSVCVRVGLITEICQLLNAIEIKLLNFITLKSSGTSRKILCYTTTTEQITCIYSPLRLGCSPRDYNPAAVQDHTVTSATPVLFLLQSQCFVLTILPLVYLTLIGSAINHNYIYIQYTKYIYNCQVH